MYRCIYFFFLFCCKASLPVHDEDQGKHAIQKALSPESTDINITIKIDGSNCMKPAAATDDQKPIQGSKPRGAMQGTNLICTASNETIEKYKNV